MAIKDIFKIVQLPKNVQWSGKNGKFKFCGNFILSMPLNKGSHFSKFGIVIFRLRATPYISVL